MKLNKKEFIAKIAKEVNATSVSVQKVLAAFQVVVMETLSTEKEVQILDIGKLKISHRKSRKGINPKTKAVITLAAKDVPRLSASKKLKSFVAGTDGVKAGSFVY